MTTKPIVCAVDLAKSGEDAVMLAAAFARKIDAPLHLVHAVSAVDEDLRAAGLDPAVEPAARALAEQLAARHDEAETKVRGLAEKTGATFELRGGHPWEIVLATAKEKDAALVVVGPHVRAKSWVDRAAERVLGTTAQRVVRHAGRPVLVASGHVVEAVEALEDQARVLVGHDFAPGGRAAFAAARRFLPGSRWILAHVLQDPFMPGDAPVSWGELREQWSTSLKEDLLAIAKEAGDLAEPRVVEGKSAPALLELARESDADLVVVGAHHGGRLHRLLLGSTAERCVAEADLPVLVVPPEEASP